MNKEKSFQIIVGLAIIADLIFFVSLLYSNNKLRKEIAYLKHNNIELQDCFAQQSERITNIEVKINQVIEPCVNEIREQKKIESDPYYKAVNDSDNTIFLTDFEKYVPNSNDVKITEQEARKIAQKGFEESKRIASEGTDDISSETIKMEEVFANNYFTRYYYQGNEVYDKIKRNCYVVQRENDMGCGVTIYVDATTGLIIAGRAFGD